MGWWLAGSAERGGHAVTTWDKNRCSTRTSSNRVMRGSETSGRRAWVVQFGTADFSAVWSMFGGLEVWALEGSKRGESRIKVRSRLKLQCWRLAAASRQKS